MLKKVEYFFIRGIKILRNEGLKSFLTKFRMFVGRTLQRKKIFHSNLNSQISDLFINKFVNTSPIRTVFEDNSDLRINIVTDTLDEGSLFGGVATSIIFSMMLANKIGCPLRVITRDPAFSRTSAFFDIAKLHDIQVPSRYEFYNAPFCMQGRYALPVSKNDVFISTSWWSSHVVKQLNLRKKYIYILQEYEKIFYPNGDEHVMIDEIFHDEDMVPVVNTGILYNYLVQKDYTHIARNGLYFEPAFPYANASPREKFMKEKEKANLFFYARPGAPRNLFYTGVALIDDAINTGVLDMKEWNIIFAGNHVVPIKFCDGSSPAFLGKLNLSQYSDFISDVDVGVGLMLAPCPSYIPLDLACAGAVVLTNTYENKTSLESYSKNIICAAPEKKSLLENLKAAIKLSENLEERYSNFTHQHIGRDWEKSFSPVIEKLFNQINQNLL